MRISNHIKSAVGNLSQHKQLSHDELTTSDFGQIVPVCVMSLLPRDKFRISSSCFSRVSPMIFPTYGDCEIVTNFHSVQYNKVWKDFDIFVTGEKYSGSTAIRLPIIKFSTILKLFSDPIYGLVYEGNADINNYDIVLKMYSEVSAPNKYYFLSVYGRYVRKVLSSLGYPFVTYIDDRVLNENSDYKNKNYLFSALPLMSFFKIYSDFYESRQYSSTSIIREILRQCYVGLNNGSTTSYWVSVSGDLIDDVPYNTLTFNAFQSLFLGLKLLYPSDYFTSAQQHPSLVGGSQSIASFGSSGNSLSYPFYQSVGIVQDESSTNYLSPLFNKDGTQGVFQSNPMHRILENFENLVRRFNLVGSREIDRIRSLFGIRPSVAKNQYSTFNGGFKSPLRIQDVTSTSAEPSVDNFLGSYAGKGIVSDSGSVSVESDDFGILIGISFIQIKPLYCPGLKREVLKSSYLSYYNPEFDHGYSMAVSLGELRTQIRNSVAGVDLLQVFGYQQAYDEYRHEVSRVNGDFYDNDLSSFSFARFSPGTSAQTTDVIYQRGPQQIYNDDPVGPYNEFQRIFVDGSGRDHFYLYYSFDIDALRPVRTSSECFDLGVGDVSTSNNPVI